MVTIKLKETIENAAFLLNVLEKVNIELSETSIKISKCNKLMGIHFDDKVIFDTHFDNIYKSKLNALGRTKFFMELKNKIITNLFLTHSLFIALLFRCFIIHL